LKELKEKDPPEIPEECEEIPRPISDTPFKPLGSDVLKLSEPVSAHCFPGKIKFAFKTVEELITYIPYAPRAGDFSLQAVGSNQKSKLAEVLPDEFLPGKFFHKVRGVQGSVRKIKGPAVWSCGKDRRGNHKGLASKIKWAWDKACEDSGYYPFAMYSGLKGSHIGGGAKQGVWTGPGGAPGAIAFQQGMTPAAYGLSLVIDPWFCGDPTDTDFGLSHSIWTGAWTPSIGGNPAISEELFDMGVFSNSDSENGSNCWSDYQSRKLRTIEDAGDIFGGAEDFYVGDQSEAHFENIMSKTLGSAIVPINKYPLPNPTQWLISFCEASGMKWANTFFLRKRYVRPWWVGDLDVFGEWEPTRWTSAEKRRLDTIYGITDLVAKIEQISWKDTPQTPFDRHEMFQFWDGPSNFITWAELDRARPIADRHAAYKAEEKALAANPQGASDVDL